MAGSILSGDVVGRITDKMCLRCEQFVYENERVEPTGYKPDCFVYLCLWCHERLLPIECQSQRERDWIRDTIATREANRLRLAQEKREKKVQEQMTLWELE